MTHAPDPAASPPLLRWLATLGDLLRLRLLRLLEAEELSVGELAQILQLPQSTVSRHLKLLHESEWIVRRAEGTASLYRMDPAALDEAARRLWALAREQLGSNPTLGEDDRRMATIIAQRPADGAAFLRRLGGEWDRVRRELFGERFMTDALASLLDPGWVVADLGCGTGVTVEHLAPVVRRVIAVDREPAMLDAARRRLTAHHNVEFRLGDLCGLDLADASVDAAMILLVTVYLETPAAAVAEAARILRRGGAVLIVDMVAHDRTTYRHTMGHHHLGFSEANVRGWAAAAGLADVRYRALPPDPDARGPGLFVAVLRR